MATPFLQKENFYHLSLALLISVLVNVLLSGCADDILGRHPDPGLPAMADYLFTEPAAVAVSGAEGVIVIDNDAYANQYEVPEAATWKWEPILAGFNIPCANFRLSDYSNFNGFTPVYIESNNLFLDGTKCLDLRDVWQSQGYERFDDAGGVEYTHQWASFKLYYQANTQNLVLEYKLDANTESHYRSFNIILKRDGDDNYDHYAQICVVQLGKL